MLIETLTVNSLPSRRKHYNNIHCSIWEEKTCEKQHEWQQERQCWQSSKHVAMPLVAFTPALLTATVPLPKLHLPKAAPVSRAREAKNTETP